MTNEEKFKTSEERQKEFNKFCSTMHSCAKCDIFKRNNICCMLNWLAAEYKEPKQDLLFTIRYCDISKAGWYVVATTPIAARAVSQYYNDQRHAQNFCDDLNSIALAWHRRMNEKERSNG